MPTFGPKDGNKLPYDLKTMFVSEKGDLYHSSNDLVAWFRVVSEPETRNGTSGYEMNAHFSEIAASSGSFSGSMNVPPGFSSTEVKYLTGAVTSGRGKSSLDLPAMEILRPRRAKTGSYFKITDSEALKNLSFDAGDGGDNKDPAFTFTCWVKPPANTSIVKNSAIHRDAVRQSGTMGLVWKDYQYSMWIKTGTLACSIYHITDDQTNPAGIDRISAFTGQVIGDDQPATSHTGSLRSGPDMSAQRGPWWHVAATYDGSQSASGMKLYVNGIPTLAGTSSRYTGPTFSGASGMVHTGSGFYIGAARDEDDREVFITGSISDVAIWKTNLTDEGIRAVYHASLNGMRKARSGYLTNPPRVRLHEYDNKYGTDTYHYPAAKRLLGDVDFKGNKKSWYDDTRSIYFQSPFAESKIYFWKRPEHKTKISLEDNRTNPHKVHFIFDHNTGSVGEIVNITSGTTSGTVFDLTVGIQGKYSAEKVSKAFIRAVNECKQLHIRAERFYDDDDPGTVSPVRLTQQNVGSTGNTVIGLTGSVNIHIKNVPSGSPDLRTPTGLTDIKRFTGGSERKVVYPMMLQSSSIYLTSSIVSPNLFSPQSQASGSSNITPSQWGGGIVAPGVVKKGVSDHSARHGSIDINPARLFERTGIKSQTVESDLGQYKLQGSGTFDQTEFTREVLTPFDESAHPFSFDFRHNRLVDPKHSTDLSMSGEFFGTGSNPSIVGYGFASKLGSKHVIEIDLTPTTGSTQLKYTTGSGQMTMAYFQFNEHNKGGSPAKGDGPDYTYYDAEGPSRSFKGIGLQKQLLLSASASDIIDSGQDAPGGPSSPSTAELNYFVDNLYAGFGQGTLQRSHNEKSHPAGPRGKGAGVIKRTWDNASWSSPITTFGFPFHPKYHATSSMTYPLSGVIDGPFLFEKAVYVFKARTTGSNVISWGEGKNQDEDWGGPDYGGTTTISDWSNLSYDTTLSSAQLGLQYPAYANLPAYTFFILNQRKANVDSGVEQAVNRVTMVDNLYTNTGSASTDIAEYPIARPFMIPTGAMSSGHTSIQTGSSVTQGYQISKDGPGLYVDTIRDIVSFSRFMLAPDIVSGSDPMAYAKTIQTKKGGFKVDPRTYADTVISGVNPNSEFVLAAGGSSLGSHNLNLDGEVISLAFEARCPIPNKRSGLMFLGGQDWTDEGQAQFVDSLQTGYNNPGSSGLGISSGRRILGGEFPGLNTLYRNDFKFGTVSEGFIDNAEKDYKVAPYLLHPSDELIFGWQAPLPQSISGSSYSQPQPGGHGNAGDWASGSNYCGWTFPPPSVSGYNPAPGGGDRLPSIQILPGEGKLYIFGTYIKEGSEKVEPTSTPTSLNIHEAIIGGSEVYDQFDTEPAMMHSGTIYDNIVEGSMNARGLELKHKDSAIVRRVYSRQSESTAGSTGSFTRGVRLVDLNERFYDTYLPDLGEMMKINGDSLLDGASVGVSKSGKMLTIDVSYSELDGAGDSNDVSGVITIPTPHSGTHNVLVLSQPSYFSASNKTSGDIVHVQNEGPADAFDTQWPMIFPFEPKYANIDRLSSPIDKNKSMAVITGSDGSKIRDGKITHVLLTGTLSFMKSIGAGPIDTEYVYGHRNIRYAYKFANLSSNKVDGLSSMGFHSASDGGASWTSVDSWAHGTYGYMTRSNGYIIRTGAFKLNGRHYKTTESSYGYIVDNADYYANLHPNAFGPGGDLHPDNTDSDSDSSHFWYNWDAVFGQGSAPSHGNTSPRGLMTGTIAAENNSGAGGVLADTEDNRTFANGLPPSNLPLSSAVDHIQFNSQVGFNLTALYFGIGDGVHNTVQFGRTSAPVGNALRTINNSYYLLHKTQKFYLMSQPVLRGFRYGVKNIKPEKSSAVFSRTHYGHFRDMHEQRLYSRFTNADGLQDPVITSLFVDRGTGNVTSPESTNCQNLSQHSTSSLPYFDGEARDRKSIPPDMDISSTSITIIDTTDLTEL